jgi:hypothetical protein
MPVTFGSAPADESVGAPAAALVLELSDDDLEHVVGGLERVYVYDPAAAESRP